MNFTYSIVPFAWDDAFINMQHYDCMHMCVFKSESDSSVLHSGLRLQGFLTNFLRDQFGEPFFVDLEDLNYDGIQFAADKQWAFVPLLMPTANGYHIRESGSLLRIFIKDHNKLNELLIQLKLMM